MSILPDSLALLLLCSHLDLPEHPDPGPLSVREWNPLNRKLQAASLHPGDLLRMSASDLQASLTLSLEEVTRITKLLERRNTLIVALERLEALDIHVLTRVDVGYPERYRQRLRDSAPLVLFFAGERELLGQPGIAVVGSRHLDAAGQESAVWVGSACGLSRLVLYSGGARGVDTISMNAALESRGSAVSVLADNLERTVQSPEIRAALGRGDLCIATPYTPSAGFSVGAAMGRNRLIYALADFAIVVASEAETGGTWAGATEALKAGWVPVFVLEHPAMPEGNRLLLQKGGLPFPHPFPHHFSMLRGWLQEHAGQVKPKPQQLGLF